MASEDTDFDALMIALGRQFVARGMDSQAAFLRALIRRRRERAPDLWWDEFIAVQWFARFQIAPFDRVLPALSAGAGCPRCNASDLSGRGSYVRASWKGGHVAACHNSKCGQSWLIVDSTP